MKVYIGYDSREDDAYKVCKYSLTRRGDVTVIPLIQNELRDRGLYNRPPDVGAATEFSLTRFLVPALADEQFVVFADCDFLFLTDINTIMDEIDPSKAVSVVQHDYKPTEVVKMDGCVQTIYPRKNWSSFMVFNTHHPACKSLTKEVVNTATPAYLHRFGWCDDEFIGELPIDWNYLEGWYPANHKPKAIHYTRGGPWFENMKNCDFAEEWQEEWKSYQSACGQRAISTDTLAGLQNT